MAAEVLQIVRLKDDFYRDGFYRLLLSLGMIAAAIVSLVATSLYLHFTKPDPIGFATGEEWRTLSLVPIEQPYPNTPHLLQWVSEVVPSAFTYDFVNYANQLKQSEPYFTANGRTKFLALLDQYANYNKVRDTKLFISGIADGAPVILNQGLLPEKKYGWWIQIPIKLSYSGQERGYDQPLPLQVLIVRVPTLNNLDGVAIENIVLPTSGKPAGG